MPRLPSSDDLPTIIATLAILIFLAYLTNRMLNLYITMSEGGFTEGLANQDNTNTSGTTTSTSSTTAANGIAANAESFAAAIKSSTTSINDKLLISKYRTHYENIVINAEDNVNAAMLYTLVNTPLGKDGNIGPQTLAMITAMQNSKVALNEVMKYIDAQ